ncbi:hypothetical protein A3770_02p13230 [Chloropicon primus]|uniref:Protein unc-45 homolog B n=2 Tax=Chloropicon primus TaxID=1764295 RepID=A0A5B8MGK7_9CHLO|nr:hypothetical protein A3770_02p13230 [Chloropicon primus]|eukprot:QDZ18805.1 hypothetical protein A3770_02p13230 [Chloropicon primus]
METEALALKEEGNGLFKKGDYAEALGAYTKALVSCGDAEAGGIRTTLYSNRAAVNLKLGNLEAAIEDCATCLSFDDSNAKARFRRAEALQRLGRLEEALKDVAVLCREHPKSKAFQDKARAIRDRTAASDAGSTSLLSLVERLQDFKSLSESEQIDVLGTVARSASGSAIEAEAFCCKGGLSALASAVSGEDSHSANFGRVCSCISILASASTSCSVLCSAFVRDKLGDFGVRRIAQEEQVVALMRMYDGITRGAAEGGQLDNKEAVWVICQILEQVPKLLREHVVRQLFASKVPGLWEHLLGDATLTSAIMMSLLWSGETSRQSLLHLMGIAKEALGMETLKSQILLIMSGKAMPKGVQLSELESAMLIEALFILMPEEGAWLLNSTPAYDQVLHIAEKSNDEPVLKVLSSILSHLASNKEGQSKFKEPEIQKILARMTKVEDYQSRANSLLVLAKIAKNEGDHREDEGIVLEALMLLGEISDDAKGLSPQRHAEVATSLVEVLVFMVDDSAVKDQIATQLMMNAEIIGKLCKGAQSSSSLSFGLSRVFAFAVATRKDMEAVPLLTEDSDEDQEARKMASEIMRKQEKQAVEDDDTPQRCSVRKLAFVKAQGISSLPLLLRMGSPTTKQQIAVTLFHCASEQALRPVMVQQGALNLIMKLVREDQKSDNKCKLLASHALARILISINPALLEDVQIAAYVGPLLLLIGRDYALQQFEGLLALTNLATAGLELQEKIVAQGFATIEDLQFSQNEMVVRAATELLCNCVSCDKVLASIKDESRQKLWISLSFSDDMPLALASAGALAMASGDPGVSKSIIDNGLFEDFLKLAKSEDEGMQHRACVTLENLCANESAMKAMALDARKRVLSGVEDTLDVVVTRVGTARDSLEQALASLRKL